MKYTITPQLEVVDYAFCSRCMVATGLKNTDEKRCQCSCHKKRLHRRKK